MRIRRCRPTPPRRRLPPSRRRRRLLRHLRPRPAMPPAGSPTVIRATELRFHPVNESLIEPQTYLYYIQTPFTPTCRRRVGAVHRCDREVVAGRLQASVGDQLPRQPVDRDPRRSVPERRAGQAHHLPHGRAPARQDRGLHGLDQDRAHEGRREDERGERVAATRLVPRRRRRAPREGHRQVADVREGLRVCRGDLRPSSRCRAGPSS